MVIPVIGRRVPEEIRELVRIGWSGKNNECDGHTN
jgi:hypothetical protein